MSRVILHDRLLRMISRPETTAAEQDAAIADYKLRGFAALDLTPEVVDACILFVALSVSTRPRPVMVVDTLWISYQLVNVWACSYSTRVANETKANRSVIASVYRRLRRLQRRDLVYQQPNRAGKWSRWSLTWAGTLAAEALLETSECEFWHLEAGKDSCP